ncbi:relaxase/mobilization nuclease domain-containing protein [Flavimarina sp. Hel_I_48]|uniref:relaxase/mobilization nuclease domain-containing protein n=1 Tax=Flavimarina sp. Hel_I_48 TaxID=1392488 RepID=UPI00068C421B|nr:relaxase/mobilization nuclease domain-containing protein [Flavimarina sp. Hel_I_48]
MIARAKSIAHGGAGINYALEKDGAEIIDKRFVVGDTGAEIKGEFRIFQNLNTRAENNDLSFVLSPEPKDGQKLSNEDFKAISDSFLKKMNLEKHQAIIVKHTDRNHAHLHLFVNRIDSNGKAYKDSWISKESQTKADQIAREMGLPGRAKSRRPKRKSQRRSGARSLKNIQRYCGSAPRISRRTGS